MPNIPLSLPEILEEDITAVNKVLRSGQVAFGEVQRSFERDFASYCGTSHAVAVSSGTAALHIAVLLSGISEGDEVIVSPFSFIASSNVLLYQNAQPVFVDIEEETLGMDPALVSSAINSRTKGILPTHVFGHPCKIESIANVCRENQLVLIEDNCESLGATVDTSEGRKKTGQFGDFAAYGFYPNKLMTTGEGGMLTVRNPLQDQKARMLRNQGRSSMMGAHLVHEVLGYNYRMSEIQSALGSAQLSRLTHTIQRRQQLADHYNILFHSVPDVRVPGIVPGNDPAWFVYYIRVDAQIRDRLIAFLSHEGIQTRPYFYPSIHLQPFYRERFGTKEGDFPVAERVSQEIIALPFYNQMEDHQIEQVVDAVRRGLASL